MNEPLSAQKVYEYLFAELKAHKADKLGELKLSTVEDDDEEIGCVLWNYEPSTTSGLDVSTWYDDNGYGSVRLGPVQFFLDPTKAIALKEDLLKTFLMALNGQLKVIVSYPEVGGLNKYQAAELYLIGLEKLPTVLRVLSNHTRSRKLLKATTLSNGEQLDKQVISPSFWLLPDKTNGKYPKGRSVAFDAPTPLSRKDYKTLDESLTIQGLGGEAGEPFWSYFYRTTEFWAVTIPIALFDFWLIDTYFKEENLLSSVIKGVIHIINTALVIFLTSKLLAWRQAKLDADQIPRFERTEDRITLLGASRILSVISVSVLLFAPMWTPSGDFTNLFPGTKYILAYPMILVGLIGMLAPLIFNKTGSFLAKLTVSVIYAMGIGFVFTANTLYMNTADNSPEIALQWSILGLVMPFIIAIWMFYKTFAKPNPRDEKEWK